MIKNKVNIVWRRKQKNIKKLELELCGKKKKRKVTN